MDEMTTIETGGIELVKYFEETEFHLPSIVYKFTNTRDEDAIIRLTERVPESIEPDELGFHNDYGWEHWAFDGRNLVFEYQLDGDSEFKTVIGIRRSAAPDPEDVLQEPEGLEIDPVEDTKSLEKAGNSFTRPAGQANGDAPLDTPATIETTLQKDDASDQKPSEQPDTESSGSTIVDQFVTELKNDEISEQNLVYLREQIGTSDDASRSVDARIKQLQHDHADLRAFKSALEGLLDEHGSADEILEKFESRLDEINENIASIEALLDDLETEVSAAHSDIEDNEKSIAANSSALSDVIEDVDSLSSSITEVEMQLPEYDIEERISDMDAELASVRRIQKKLRDVFAAEPNNDTTES